MESNQKQIIIRRLGKREEHFASEDGFVEVTNSYLLKCRIDLYENIDILKNSILEWANLHPFLNCSIADLPENDGDYKLLKYFVFNEETMIKNNNVKYLVYKAKTTSFCKNLPDLLIDLEQTLSIDAKKELLWRLVFLKLDNSNIDDTSNSEQGIYYYQLIQTVHHSNSEGRNYYMILLQLFSIIEDHISKRESNCIKYSVLPSIEQIFYNKYENNNVLRLNPVDVKIPTFCNTTKDINKCTNEEYLAQKNIPLTDYENGIFYTIDNKPYITVREIISLSHSIPAKLKKIIVNNNEYQLIVKKCKENKAKFSSCINTITSIALRNLYKQLDELNFETFPICRFNSVSLRPFQPFDIHVKNDQDRYEQMGYFASNLFTNSYYNIDEDNNFVNNFWKHTNDDWLSFQQRLNMGEQFKRYVSKSILEEEMFYHYGITSMGVMPSSLTNNKLIEMNEWHMVMNYMSDNFTHLFFGYVVTIDNKLCWSISYNSHFFPSKICDLYEQEIMKVIRKLTIEAEI